MQLFFLQDDARKKVYFMYRNGRVCFVCVFVAVRSVKIRQTDCRFVETASEKDVYCAVWKHLSVTGLQDVLLLDELHCYGEIDRRVCAVCAGEAHGRHKRAARFFPVVY